MMKRKAAIPILSVVLILVMAGCVSAGTPTVEPPTAPDTSSAATASAMPSETAEEKNAERDGEGTETTRRSYAGDRPAPKFPGDLSWLNTDRPLTLEQLKGKIVLLDFWTYGCINCIHIIPDLKRLEEEYSNELVVIGVHSAKFENESQTDNIRQIILRYGLEHPVVNDKDFEVWKAYGARAWPTLALIDPAGNLVGTHAGEGVYPIFKPVIESLVKEFEAMGILDRTPLDLKLEKEGLPETVLSFPGKVLADGEGGRLFVADTNHNRVVVADIESGEVQNVIGSGKRGFNDGDFRTATFAQPQGLALSEDGQALYVADTENHAVRKVDLMTEKVTTLAGTGEQARTYPPQGGVVPDVALNSPWDLALDGERLYIAMAGSHQIWAMDLSTGSIVPFAGSGREGTDSGQLKRASLAQPSGLTLDGKGRLYFADSESSSIRWAGTDAEEGEVGHLVGSKDSLFEFGDVDGMAGEARLQHPLGIVHHDGALYVADTYNSKIKRVEPQMQQIQTFLGNTHGWRDGSDPLFYEPGGIDVASDKLYVADTNNHSVRVIDLATKETDTLVLKGIQRFTASSGSGDFSGKVVKFDPVNVAAGDGQVLLDVTLPEGYKVNEEAPSSMAWQVDGDVAQMPADANRSMVAPEFPLTLNTVYREGQGTLTGDLNIVYCEKDRPSICLLDQVRLQVPLQVDGAGDSSTVRLEYEIELPGDAEKGN